VLLSEPRKVELLAYESGSGPQPERVARVWVTNPPVGHLFEALVVLPEGTAAAAAAGSKDLVRQWTHVSHTDRTATGAARGSSIEAAAHLAAPGTLISSCAGSCSLTFIKAAAAAAAAAAL
jgi:hypothetical protein